MALTMTRTRTQTALTKLATCLANINGELELLEAVLPAQQQGAARLGMERRRAELQADRGALQMTLRVFDPNLDPAHIGAVQSWLKPFGRGKAAVRRYQASFKNDAND